MAIATGTAILGSAIIGGVASAVSASKSSKAAGKASDAQVTAANLQVAESRRQFDLILGISQPQITAGNAASNQLVSLFGLNQFTGQPGATSFDQSVAPVAAGSPTVSGPQPQISGTPVPFNPAPLNQALETPGATRDQLLGGPGQIASGEILNERRLNSLLSTISDQRAQLNSGVPNAGPAPVNQALAAPGQEGLSQSEIQNQIFQGSPGFQFRLNAGREDLDRRFAAAGLTGSGARLKALEEFRQGTASSEFGNFVNQLLAIKGGGQAATSNFSSFSLGTTNQINNALSNAGDARASGFVGQANAFGQGAAGVASAFGGATNNLLLNKFLTPQAGGNPLAALGPGSAFARFTGS